MTALDGKILNISSNTSYESGRLMIFFIYKLVLHSKTRYQEEYRIMFCI